MAVCLKPRLIKSGIEKIKNNDDSQDIITENDFFGNYGKVTKIKSCKIHIDYIS